MPTRCNTFYLTVQPQKHFSGFNRSAIASLKINVSQSYDLSLQRQTQTKIIHLPTHTLLHKNDAFIMIWYSSHVVSSEVSWELDASLQKKIPIKLILSTYFQSPASKSLSHFSQVDGESWSSPLNICTLLCHPFNGLTTHSINFPFECLYTETCQLQVFQRLRYQSARYPMGMYHTEIGQCRSSPAGLTSSPCLAFLIRK